MKCSTNRLSNTHTNRHNALCAGFYCSYGTHETRHTTGGIHYYMCHLHIARRTWCIYNNTQTCAPSQCRCVRICWAMCGSRLTVATHSDNQSRQSSRSNLGLPNAFETLGEPYRAILSVSI